MTLHEAIKKILEEAGEPLSSDEIAEYVNRKRLYKRHDGNPVSSNQINARINNHADSFLKKGGKIYLIKEDEVSKAYKQFRSGIISKLNQSFKKDQETDGFKTFTEVIENIKSKDIETLAEENNYFFPNNSRFNIPSSKSKLKFEVLYQICNWYLSQYSKYGVLKDRWADFFSKLDWFQDSENIIYTESSSFNHFILKAVNQNPFSTFNLRNTITEPQPGFDQRTVYFNNLLTEIVNQKKTSFERSENKLKTGIFIPPFKIGNKRILPDQFNKIRESMYSSEMGLDKALLIVHSSFMNSSADWIKTLRKEFVNSGNIEKVINLSSVIEDSPIKLTLMIFDFRSKRDEIYFVDPDQLLNTHPNLIDIINSNGVYQNVSRKTSIAEIVISDFILSPFHYTLNAMDFKVEENKRIIEVSELIVRGISGIRISERDKLYKNGEFKLIRPSDIVPDGFYLKNSGNILGIDSDYFQGHDYTVKGGIVISAFNNDIRANILPEEDSFIIDHNLYWLNLNNNLILDEYFIKELSKTYIGKQIQFFLKGSSSPKIKLSDLKKIRIQVPAINDQKSEVIALLKDDESEVDGITENDLDFIKTLKHSIKQPASSLANDYSSLQAFLIDKAREKELNLDEIIVPQFKDDKIDLIQKYSLRRTLERMGRSLTDIDYILDQAISIISINQPVKKEIELKEIIENVSSDYNGIEFKINGPRIKLLADPKQIRIMLKNFIENASRHGFIKEKKLSNPTIFIELKNKDRLNMQLFIRNNGKSLPPEFSINDFLAKGKSSKEDVGSGFGGFLVGQILKNHSGEIELGNRENFEIFPYNVEFVITLPK